MVSCDETLNNNFYVFVLGHCAWLCGKDLQFLFYVGMGFAMSKKKQKKKDKYNKEMGLASALDCFHNIQRNERAMWYWLFYVITYDDLKGNV